MATNDITAVSINSDGWSADVTIEGWSAEAGDVAYDYGTPESGSGNVTFTVVSEGYNSSGTLTTITRTVYGTKTVRQPYPNNASLDETASGSDLVIRIALSECVYNDDKNGGAGTSGTDPTVTIAAGWARHSTTTDSAAATGLAVTNNSTLDYPKVIGQWDWQNTPAWKRVEGAFDVAFRARHGFGISAVALSATGVTSSHVDSGTVTTLSTTQHQNGLYSESYIHNVASLASFTQGENITLKAVAYPAVGDADSILDTSTNTTGTDDIRGLTQITCTCDKTGALKSYAVVTTTGNDGTGYNKANSTIGTCTTNTDMRGTDNAATASALATVDTNVDAILVDTGTTLPAQISGLNDPTAAAIADAVWDEVLSGHLTAGTTGNALNAAGAAGDPWTTTLPGAYGAGTAGYIVGNNLDAASSSLATSAALATVDANVDAVLVDTGTTLPATLTTIEGKVDTVDTVVDGIQTDLSNATDGLGAIKTAVDAVPTATENADALLNRDMSAVSDTNARTPLNALRFLRNKYSVSGSTLTVTKEDDSTSAWTSTLTTDATADPVTGSDPA